MNNVATVKYRQTEKGRETNKRVSKRWRSENKVSILEYQKLWKTANPDKVLHNTRVARCKHHGLTLEAYNRRLQDQGGNCAVCGEPPIYKKNQILPLAIDHNHNCCKGTYSCGKCICGLVHPHCNAGMGMLKDDPILVLQAHQYLVKTRKPYVNPRG